MSGEIPVLADEEMRALALLERHNDEFDVPPSFEKKKENVMSEVYREFGNEVSVVSTMSNVLGTDRWPSPLKVLFVNPSLALQPIVLALQISHWRRHTRADKVVVIDMTEKNCKYQRKMAKLFSFEDGLFNVFRASVSDLSEIREKFGKFDIIVDFLFGKVIVPRNLLLILKGILKDDGIMKIFSMAKVPQDGLAEFLSIVRSISGNDPRSTIANAKFLFQLLPDSNPFKKSFAEKGLKMENIGDDDLANIFPVTVNSHFTIDEMFKIVESAKMKVVSPRMKLLYNLGSYIIHPGFESLVKLEKYVESLQDVAKYSFVEKYVGVIPEHSLYLVNEGTESKTVSLEGKILLRNEKALLSLLRGIDKNGLVSVGINGVGVKIRFRGAELRALKLICDGIASVDKIRGIMTSEGSDDSENDAQEKALKNVVETLSDMEFLSIVDKDDTLSEIE